LVPPPRLGGVYAQPPQLSMSWAVSAHLPLQHWVTLPVPQPTILSGVLQHCSQRPGALGPAAAPWPVPCIPAQQSSFVPIAESKPQVPETVAPVGSPVHEAPKPPAGARTQPWFESQTNPSGHMMS
jgi:hypothetical protein